jgi:hypothetical protein
MWHIRVPNDILYKLMCFSMCVGRLICDLQTCNRYCRLLSCSPAGREVSLLLYSPGRRAIRVPHNAPNVATAYEYSLIWGWI